MAHRETKCLHITALRHTGQVKPLPNSFKISALERKNFCLVSIAKDTDTIEVLRENQRAQSRHLTQ